MSLFVTRPGAMLRARRKYLGSLSWRALTWPKPSTTPSLERMWFAATRSSTSAGSGAGGPCAAAAVASARAATAASEKHLYMRRIPPRRDADRKDRPRRHGEHGEAKDGALRAPNPLLRVLRASVVNPICDTSARRSVYSFRRKTEDER